MIENQLFQVNTSQLDVSKMLMDVYFNKKAYICPLLYGAKCNDYIYRNSVYSKLDGVCFSCKKLNTKLCTHDVGKWWCLVDEIRGLLRAKYSVGVDYNEI